ncbi:MAG: hypothetical protein GY842_03235 [bacterium]|nr:hypothetical protein [bacterium]
MNEYSSAKIVPTCDPPDPAVQERLQDYSAALRTIRGARGVFLLILILSVLLQVGAYAAARWGNVLQPLPVLQKQLAAPADAEVAALPADPETAETFSTYYYLIELTLPLSEFLGQVSCGLLTLSFLFAALVCLSGGLGGVRGSISAFFWMLVLLALLFPWSRWLAGGGEGVQVPGVYYTFAELVRLPLEFRDWLHEVLHYVRYLGYPLFALIIAFTSDRRFSRGYRLVQRHLEAQMKVKKI